MFDSVEVSITLNFSDPSGVKLLEPIVLLIRAKQADSDPLCLKDENCGRRTNEQLIDRTRA